MIPSPLPQRADDPLPPQAPACMQTTIAPARGPHKSPDAHRADAGPEVAAFIGTVARIVRRIAANRDGEGGSAQARGPR